MTTNKKIIYSFWAVYFLNSTAILVAQNIGINNTGTAPATTNMLEVLQTSGTTNTVGIYSRHSGNTAGTP